MEDRGDKGADFDCKQLLLNAGCARKSGEHFHLKRR